MKKLVKVKVQKKARRGAVQLEPNKFLRTLYVVSGINDRLCSTGAAQLQIRRGPICSEV